MARQTRSLVGVPAHVGTEWAVVQLPCDHSLSSTNLLDKPLPVGDTFPLRVGGDGTGEGKQNVQELLSHPTFTPRAGSQHLGKEGNKEKGACKQKGDMTLPRSAWDSEPLHDRGRKRISVASSVFPFVLCLQPGLCSLFVLASGREKSLGGCAGFIQK